MNNKKKNVRKFILSSSLVGLLIAAWGCQLISKQVGILPAPTVKLQAAPKLEIFKPTEDKHSSIRADNLNPKVLKLAITAYLNAKKAGIGTKDLLTIVDYSLPSTTPRLWVIDMSDNKVIYHTLVAHGVGSGDNYARKFSNRHGSLMSSLGLFLTGNVYNGHYGTSLNLHGLEEKFNSNALSRRIVFHQAHYVDESIINRVGRLGRSFGCLALNAKVANKIMQTIKGGSLVFCYYPDKVWLSESKMLSAKN